MVTPRDSCTPCETEGGSEHSLFHFPYPAGLAQRHHRRPIPPLIPMGPWPPGQCPSRLSSQPSLKLEPLSPSPALTPSMAARCAQQLWAWETTVLWKRTLWPSDVGHPAPQESALHTGFLEALASPAGKCTWVPALGPSPRGELSAGKAALGGQARVHIQDGQSVPVHLAAAPLSHVLHAPSPARSRPAPP